MNKFIDMFLNIICWFGMACMLILDIVLSGLCVVGFCVTSGIEYKVMYVLMAIVGIITTRMCYRSLMNDVKLRKLRKIVIEEDEETDA